IRARLLAGSLPCARSGRPQPDYRPAIRRAGPTPRHAPPPQCPLDRLRPPEPGSAASLRAHLHALLAEKLAAPPMGEAVDGGAALKADAHAAQRRPWLACDRGARLRTGNKDG